MKRVPSVNRSVRPSPLALAAAAAVAAIVPSSVRANSPLYVVGTDLTQASSYSTTSGGTAGGVIPTVANDVVVDPNTPTPGSLTLNASLNAGTLNDLNAGATVINDNGSGGTTITLFASGSTANGTPGAAMRDAIYVNGGAGSSLSLTSSTGHSNTLALGNNTSYDVVTGSTFNYTAALSGGLSLTRFGLTLTGGGTINIGSLTSTATTLISGPTAGNSISVTGPGVVGAPGSAGAGEVSFNLDSAANNTYTGATTINSGSVLAINAAGTSGTLTYGATGAVADNGTLVLAPFNGRTLAFGTEIDGTGSVLFQKSTTASGAAFLTLTGTNTYTGGTSIGNPSQATTSTGTLSVSSSSALGTGPVTIYGQAAVVNALQISGGITIANAINLQGRNANVSEIVSSSGSNTLSGNITFTSGGAADANVNNSAAGTLLTLSGNFVNNVTGSHTFDLLGTGNYLLSGTIGAGGPGTTSFRQDTTGTVTLTASNSYAGTTTLAAGTLVAAATVDGSTPLSTGAVANAGALRFNSAVGQTVAGAISGAGTLSQVGTGTTALNGANTYAGATTITAGTLQANNAAGSLGTALTTITGGTLAGGTATAAGATGSGGVNLAGGTITAGTGSTNADKVGTLVVGTAATAAGTAAVALNGGTFTAKVDPTLVGTPTPEATANSMGTPVPVYTGASDELIVSNFTAGSGSVLTVNPLLTSNASGTGGPLASGPPSYFVIANATGADSSSPGLAMFLKQFTLSSTVDAAGNTYNLDAAADTANGGDDLLLEVTAAAPEPTSLLLAGIAAAPLALGRRSRRAAVVTR